MLGKSKVTLLLELVSLMNACTAIARSVKRKCKTGKKKTMKDLSFDLSF